MTKTRKNRDFGGLASPRTGIPKREQNGAQNVPKSASKMEPFGSPGKCKNHCNSLGFRSKRGPEGLPIFAQNELENEPTSFINLCQIEPNSIILVGLGVKIRHFGGLFGQGPKGGGRKSSEHFLEDFLVNQLQIGLRRLSRKSSNPVRQPAKGIRRPRRW